jgi:catalase
MVAHLLNVDSELAQRVATGLGLAKLPEAAVPAMAPRQDLTASPALSILQNGPQNFKGRKLGVLMTDGADAAVFKALQAAATAEGALIKVIAPTIAGVKDSQGALIAADEKIGGGPSVVFDAVVLLVSDSGVAALDGDATTKDFLADAFAHCKFIGYTAAALPLFKATGLAEVMDAGCIDLGKRNAAQAFIKACRQLRLWEREANVDKT